MLARIYWIYTQLKSEARPSVARFKRCFEVSRGTFKRDIEFMKDRLGAPVVYDPAVNGYYLTDSSFELPAFWFDRMHLLMMLGACRQLAAMSDVAPEEIRQFRQRIEDLLAMHYGGKVLDLVSFATVQFGIYKGGEVQQVALRFSPGTSRSIRDEVWHRDQEATDLPDGGLLLTLKVADLTEIRRHALMYGPDVEVLEPPELRRQVTEAAEGILKIYGNSEKK